MPSPDSTHRADAQLLAAYSRGDDEAARVLFERYYRRLIALVGARRGWVLRQTESSADVVQSVFRSVFARGRAGQIELGDDEPLWPLLVTIALHKVYNHAAHWNRQRRTPAREAPAELGELLQKGPAPEDAAMVSELIDELVAAFPERRQRIVALLIQGESVPAISRTVGVSQRTVYHTRQAVADTLQAVLHADE